MFVRVLVVSVLVCRPLLLPLATPMLAMGAACALAALFLLRRGGAPPAKTSDEVPLQNPFSLRSAIRFALLFAAVLLVVALVKTYLPGRGLYAVAALAGLTDVDAITLSMASCVSEGECTTQTGVIAIVIAALSNTFVKAGIVASLGAASMRVPILGATAAIALLGLGALLFV
jgi:uncharacterized membrane protein (DUF4010 family)